MLLGSKAVVFYALFSGRTGGRNAKRSIKRTDLCRRIINIIPKQSWKRRIARKISDYHESDIADAMEQMTPEERKKLYPLLGEE